MKRLLALYPRAWRQRYGDEFLALLEAERPAARLVLDVVVGALDAWLRPQVGRAAAPASAGGARRGSGHDVLDKFTRRSRNVLQSAADEADTLRNDFIGTEHLLLGLLHEPNGFAIAVLRSLAVEPATVREAVEARLGIGTGGRHHERSLTPRAKKAIHLSVEEAQRLRHPYVGTEHILLGLMREGEGIAATVLTELTRVDLTELRRRVVRALNDR